MNIYFSYFSIYNFNKMSILNNRIQNYKHFTIEELIEVLEKKYYEEEGTIFLYDKFYNDFKDHFNITLNKFIDYVEKHELYISVNLVYEFFYCSPSYEQYFIKKIKPKK